MADPFPLLRGKVSTYQGKKVYTADALEPCAWACGKCGMAYRGAIGEDIARSCCTPVSYVGDATGQDATV